MKKSANTDNSREGIREDKLRAIGFEGTCEQWYVREDTRNEIYARGGLRVAEVWAASRKAWENIQSPETLKEEEANALLIGAAPDLLVALNTLVKTFDPDKQSIYSFARESIDAAKEAINKALGK
jgi:hypothetical protein|nr:MAG TPA: hypothetical protein [Caudoviricetes sp.]